MEQLVTYYVDVALHLLVGYLEVSDVVTLRRCSTILLSFGDSKEVLECLRTTYNILGTFSSFSPLFFQYTLTNHPESIPLLPEELLELAMVNDDVQGLKGLIGHGVIYPPQSLSLLVFRKCYNVLRSISGVDIRGLVDNPNKMIDIIDQRVDDSNRRPQTFTLIKILLPCLFFNHDPHSYLLSPFLLEEAPSHKLEFMLLQKLPAERIVEQLVIDRRQILQIAKHDRDDVLKYIHPLNPELGSYTNLCSPKITKFCLDNGYTKERLYSCLCSDLVFMPTDGPRNISWEVLQLVEELITPNQMWALANQVVSSSNIGTLEWLLRKLSDVVQADGSPVVYENSYQGRLLSVRRLFRKYGVIDGRERKADIVVTSPSTDNTYY